MMTGEEGKEEVLPKESKPQRDLLFPVGSRVSVETFIDRKLAIGELVMGGHGGLNILPQKRWNVYNYDNREKVRQDEEAAAKEEQLKREQVRKRDAEFRLEQLRTARGLAPLKKAAEPANEPAAEPAIAEPAIVEPKSNHINLFEGIRIFDPIKGLDNEGGAKEDGSKRKKMKKEEVASNKVINPDDEKYRLGYGVAGKGVKLPWYLERRSNNEEDDESGVELLKADRINHEITVEIASNSIFGAVIDIPGSSKKCDSDCPEKSKFQEASL
ncbi:hypothetical protein JRO89_XS15G0011900 [Xanthoceras sorbifolium]|uniref:CBF1-interacting co-repressor CIR N-terminal domain-containing protein n=1 Tax=Xanthoceras sorbifolium TaxID=99658 RepID=A0ABQ8H0N2_9ROSI|nr:hypothetical protein JRO89_XS15G0011900 [Xanthoceras sorbifolium]